MEIITSHYRSPVKSRASLHNASAAYFIVMIES